MSRLKKFDRIRLPFASRDWRTILYGVFRAKPERVILWPMTSVSLPIDGVEDEVRSIGVVEVE